MSADASVVLVADDAAALEALSRKIGRKLAGAGWSRLVSSPFIAVYAPATSRLEVVAALDGHGVMVGEMFDRTGRSLAAAERGALACRNLDVQRARDIVSEFWGRYVLVRQGSGGASILRDPSGAVEVVTWRKEGVSVIAPHAPSTLDCLLPDDLAIDQDAVREMLKRSGGYRHELGLSGLTPVAAGALATVGRAGICSKQIWRPADIYLNERNTARPDLREVVDRAVQALAGRADVGRRGQRGIGLGHCGGRAHGSTAFPRHPVGQPFRGRSRGRRAAVRAPRRRTVWAPPDRG